MKKNLNVIITKDSKFAISDWELDSWFDQLVSGDDVYVATATMLNELRLGVRLGIVDTFSFDFEGQIVNVLKDGQLDKWPNNLGDHIIIQMDALVAGISKDEAKKKYQEGKK